MRMKKVKPERRRSPRVEKRLSLRLAGADVDLTTETKNISAMGVYCRVDRHIPYMSKLRVTLLLPVKQGHQTRTHTIQCDATVVRSESQIIEHGKEMHFVALFFERIGRSDAKRIGDYLCTNLAAGPTPSSK